MKDKKKQAENKFQQAVERETKKDQSTMDMIENLRVMFYKSGLNDVLEEERK